MEGAGGAAGRGRRNGLGMVEEELGRGRGGTGEGREGKRMVGKAKQGGEEGSCRLQR